MALNTAGIELIDVLYRVSTRAQEAEGESLYNQRREVETKWAEPAGIKVRRRIEVAESGKASLKLSGNAFVFNRRAEYTDLIVEYQSVRPSHRPDAVVIDWVDRWSRNVLEYSGLVAAFRMLGIRLLAIGDGLDLTDPRNDLVTHVRAAIGQEQLRIIKEKVSEARRSRRERGKWQGGTCPDGYRTHERQCSGLNTISKETPDGKKHHVKVRACNCPQTVLRRDPEREATIAAIWQLLENSPLSWGAMTDAINERGFRRPNGKPFRWHDLYRIGENPHYAGVLAYDRWFRDEHDGSIKRRRPLNEQNLVTGNDSIPEPFISIETFWSVYRRRYNHQTRYHRRSKNGSVCDLTGLVACPECGRIMSSLFGQSSKKTGHGNPRRSPIKRYIYLWCSNAQGKKPSCSNRQRIRSERLSRDLIEQIARTTALTDEAISAALKLRSSQTTGQSLRSERKRLLDAVETADSARHALTKLLASGAMTQADVEAELFEHRRDKAAAEARVREIDAELRRSHARANFERARETVRWLAEHWDRLTVLEKAEALRLLVEKTTYTPNATVNPEGLIILEYGRAFIEPAGIPYVEERRSRRSKPA
jgi:DNA invertase Pin-like site-specific DNA recombinase